MAVSPRNVSLTVYDLTLLHDYLCPSLLGLFHSGVELDGVEYSFGSHNSDRTGVYQCLPRQNNAYYFRQRIDYGPCLKTPQQVDTILTELSEKYKGNSYRLLTKNCNHFSDELLRALVGRGLPGFVNRAASIARKFKCLRNYFEGESKCEEQNSQINELQ